MWVAQAKWGTAEEPYDCLLMPNKTITLGRHTYAQLGVASKTVSRKALEITIGPHDRRQAADPTFRPSLELKQLAAKAIQVAKPEEATFDVNKDETVELTSGTEIVVSQEFSVHIRWIEFTVGFPTAQMKGHDLKDLVKELPQRLAALGMKWTDHGDATVTHLLCVKVEKLQSPVVRAWPNQTWIVKPGWIKAVLEKSAPAPEDVDKTEARPSLLEINFTANLPDPAEYTTPITIAQHPSLTAVTPVPARATLFQGLTIWAWERFDKPDAQVASLTTAWIASGATVFLHNPSVDDVDVTEDQLRAKLRDLKQVADGRYHRYLRDQGLILPVLAKASGLIVVANGDVINEMEERGTEQMNEQVLEAFGQRYTASADHYDAFIDATLDPVFGAGRTEGDPPPASGRLPSQIPASVGGTPFRARSVASSIGANDEEQEPEPERAIAGPSGRQAEEVPQAPAAPPIKKPLKRRTKTTRPDDDYGHWDDTTVILPAPTSVPTRAGRATSMDVDEVPGSYAQTQPRKKGLVRRTATNATNWEDEIQESYAESEAKAESAHDFAASEKLYHALSKRQSEPAMDASQSSQGSSYGRGEPSSGQRRPASAMDVDEEGSFVTRSLKRAKIEHESQAEEAARKKKEAEKAEASKRKEAADEAARRRRADSENAHTGPSTAAGDRASMPPPPVPTKKGSGSSADAKRKAEEKQFLEVATKKKKGAVSDPMDLEFNGLKIARPDTTTKKSDTSKDLEGAEELAAPRLIVLHVPMYVRTKERRVGGPVEVDGVPNFKKFKKQQIIRSAPIKLTLSANKNDFGLSTDHWKSSSKHKDAPASRSNSFPSTAATQSLLTQHTNGSIASTANGAGSSRRKRLLPADSGSDDDPPIQTSKRARATPSAARKGAASSAPRQKAIVISSSDDDEQAEREVSVAAAGGGSGTMSRTMSDDEEGGSSGRRRAAPSASASSSARVPVRAAGRTARKAMVKDDSSDEDDRGGGSTFTTASSASRSARRR